MLFNSWDKNKAATQWGENAGEELLMAFVPGEEIKKQILFCKEMLRAHTHTLAMWDCPTYTNTRICHM